MNWQIEPGAQDWEADWESSRRFQLRYFRALPLREKILALEHMAEMVERVQGIKPPPKPGMRGGV